MSFHIKGFGAIAVFSAALVGSMFAVTSSRADAEDDAIAARQGFMKLVVWEAGPLFGMAKGNIPYDADVAQSHAANLKALSQYPVTGLFLEGTSKPDRPGKTVAKPEIWQDRDKFEAAFVDFQKAVAALGEQVGIGQPELAAAVGNLGKSCGGCHKPFRAKDF